MSSVLAHSGKIEADVIEITEERAKSAIAEELDKLPPDARARVLFRLNRLHRTGFTDDGPGAGGDDYNNRRYYPGFH